MKQQKETTTKKKKKKLGGVHQPILTCFPHTRLVRLLPGEVVAVGAVHR
jgi:hypothetical protein